MYQKLASRLWKSPGTNVPDGVGNSKSDMAIGALHSITPRRIKESFTDLNAFLIGIVDWYLFLSVHEVCYRPLGRPSEKLASDLASPKRPGRLSQLCPITPSSVQPSHKINNKVLHIFRPRQEWGMWHSNGFDNRGWTVTHASLSPTIK